MAIMQNSRPPWWQKGTIYQVYPSSFQDTTGNGLGDLDGIIQHLDYLNDGTPNSLGIDAVWISPFYPSPMKDHGYDVADYCAVDPRFGDLATFDRLLAQAHARNIKVIIDYVPNHTSEEHAWFQASRSSRDNPQRDWYIWREPQPDGSPPNNWGSFFGGPAWTFDEASGQFYLHQFLPGQPELNWRNAEVKAAMFDVLRFWLERGVDGFRMDVLALIIKDAALRDNPPDPNADPHTHPDFTFARLLDTYNMDQEEVHPILQEMRQLIDSYGERVMIGELWGPWERWIRYYGEHNDECHMPFNFRLMYTPWSAAAMRQLVKTYESHLPKGAWPNYVLGNHDQMRFATRFGGQSQARLATLMLLTLRGTPTLYYGDELGLENGVIPTEQLQDPQALNLGAAVSRDVARTPMQWNASPHAGFSSVTPWLPVSPDYRTRNVAAQGEDPDSMLSFFRRLVWLRREAPALAVGDFIPLGDDPDIFAYRRQLGEQSVIVVLNFAAEPRVWSLESGGRLLLSTHPGRKAAFPDGEIQLESFEGVVLEN